MSARALASSVTVGVGVGVGVNVAVRVGLGVRVGVKVAVRVGVGVRVGVKVAVRVGVGVRVTVGVGVRVGLGVRVAVGLGEDALWTVILRLWLAIVLPDWRRFAVTVTLPSRQAFRVGLRLVVVLPLMEWLSSLEQRVQGFAKPARELFVLSETLYERALSKLKARTMKSALPPTVMESDSPDISTLGEQSSRQGRRPSGWALSSFTPCSVGV